MAHYDKFYPEQTKNRKFTEGVFAFLRSEGAIVLSKERDAIRKWFMNQNPSLIFPGATGIYEKYHLNHKFAEPGIVNVDSLEYLFEKLNKFACSLMCNGDNFILVWFACHGLLRQESNSTFFYKGEHRVPIFKVEGNSNDARMFTLILAQHIGPHFCAPIKPEHSVGFHSCSVKKRKASEECVDAPPAQISKTKNTKTNQTDQRGLFLIHFKKKTDEYGEKLKDIILSISTELGGIKSNLETSCIAWVSASNKYWYYHNIGAIVYIDDGIWVDMITVCNGIPILQKAVEFLHHLSLCMMSARLSKKALLRSPDDLILFYQCFSVVTVRDVMSALNVYTSATKNHLSQFQYAVIRKSMKLDTKTWKTKYYDCSQKNTGIRQCEYIDGILYDL